MTTILGNVTQNWWAFVLRGVVAILFGIAAWFWPGLTARVLVTLFGAYALVDGLLAIVAGIAARDENQRWWAQVLRGIAGVILGVAVFVWPGVTALILLYIIAAWALATGVLEIIAAVQLRQLVANEWLLALGGLASVLFGLLLFVFPGEGALGLLGLISLYAVLFGVLLIALGIRLRGLRGTIEAAAAQRGAR
jgi:uncharacterized membrane protein HdeD (DUF308 family)